MPRLAWVRTLLVFASAVTVLSLAIWVEGANRSHIEAAPSALVSPITLTASQDTWVDELLPSQNYGDRRLADVGRPDQRDTGNQQALLSFAFAGLPQGATVLTATLELWQEASPGAAPFAIRPVAIAAAWDEMLVTWSTKPPTDSVTVGDFLPLDEFSGWKVWDVTRIVTAWAGGTPNNGILLTGDKVDPFVKTRKGRFLS